MFYCTVVSVLYLTVGFTPGVSAFISGTVKTVLYFFSADHYGCGNSAPQLGKQPRRAHRLG